MNGNPKDVFANMVLSKKYYEHCHWHALDDKVLEKMYSYELSENLQRIPSAIADGNQVIYSAIQYICRPEIFEKYGDECIRHPSNSCLHSGFARSVVEFAVAGYESDESEVDGSMSDDSMSESVADDDSEEEGSQAGADPESGED